MVTMKRKLFWIERSKRKRVCKICGGNIVVGNDCAVWDYGSMHHQCFIEHIFHMYDKSNKDFMKKKLSDIISEIISERI